MLGRGGGVFGRGQWIVVAILANQKMAVMGPAMIVLVKISNFSSKGWK